MSNAKKWLAQAKEDLLWAEASLKERMFRGACFAAQQSAEKALKAYLLSSGKISPKIHDLVVLNEQCLKLSSDFRELEEACNILSVYYISSRYPDVTEFEQYTEAVAKQATEKAKQVIDFIGDKLKA